MITAAEANEWLKSLSLPCAEKSSTLKSPQTTYQGKSMSLKIIVDTSDREECRAAMVQIFTVHPGLAEELRDGDVTTDKGAPAKSTATDPKIGVETDSRGVPWLEDVHAGTKKQNADGTWTKKRGVDPEVVEATEKAALAELGATPEPTIPPEGPTDAPPPGSMTLPGAVPPPGADAAPPVSLQDVIDLWTRLSDEGKIDEEQTLALYEQHDTNFEKMNTDETARAAFYASLVARDAPKSSGMPGMPA